MHPVAECAGLSLDACKELAFGCALNTKNVLHYKHARSERGDIIQKDTEKIPALVLADARAVVRGIYLPHGAEPLAWRATDNYIHRIRAEFGGKFVGCECREVLAKRECFLGEVIFERGDRFLVMVNRSKDTIPGALHSEAKAAATAEQIETGQFVSPWCHRYFSQPILISPSTALKSGSPVMSSALRSLASAAAKASA